MGTTIQTYPAHNTCWHTKLDGNAVIYETRYSRDDHRSSLEEVTTACAQHRWVVSFKQLLAKELDLDVANIT